MKKLFTILILFSYFCSLTQREFVLSSTKSPIGTHQLSNPLYRGLPVFNQYIKRNIFHDDKDIFRTETRPSSINRSLLSTDKILKTLEGFIKSNNEFISVKSITILTNSESYTLFITDEGETIHHLNHTSNLKDTIITGSVFLPDPITSSRQTYGIPYADNGDATNDNLNNELNEVTIPARFENDLFILENKHLKITNHSTPDIQATSRSDNDFRFNRSQKGFEEVHALYHISKFAEYIKDTLGFETIMDYQIAVDVYALNGKDNSEFISTTNPPRLNFGQGNVDDAEDPDILIHEYAHAVSCSASPGSLDGYERLALDEGLSDYWAAIYSKRMNDYNFKHIFNWDGHNEFWPGRSLDHNRKYSDGLDGNKYTDGELFGATLLDIRSSMNEILFDKLVMQSNYSWFPNISFPQAAEQIIKADSIMYMGKHANLLYTTFYTRGFFEKDYGNTTNEFDWNPIIDFGLLNQGILKIKNISTSTQVQLLSNLGKLIWQKEIDSNPHTLPYLSPGIYLFRINNKVLKVYL